MQKKTVSKSKSAKSMKSLPTKALSAKAAKGVKGGVGTQRGVTRADEAPKETLTFEYGGRSLKQ